MEPIYNPSAPIRLMKRFDSSNECSSYYIKWLIGKSLSPDIKNVKSEHFRTGPVEFDDTTTRYYQNWIFKYCIDDETKSIEISLTRTYVEDDDDGRDAPIICRLAIMNEISGITKYKVSTFIESSLDSDYNWKISADETKDLDLPNGDYVLYCWLDIPKKLIDSDSYSSDDRNNSGLILLSLGVATLFDEVVSPKTDESMGTSDVVLIADKGPKKRRFHCHRNILSIRSPVFSSMLTNKRFKEGNERTVEIDDINGGVMRTVLKYMYTGECPSNLPLAAIPKVVHAADKYMLPELKDECVGLLFEDDNLDTDWADLLTLSKLYNIDYLKKISILALSSNIRAMDEEKIREKLSKESMTELMDMAARRWERSKMIEVSNDSE